MFDIVNFRNQIEQMSQDELEALLSKLELELTQMVLDNDLVVKMAIVQSTLEDLKMTGGVKN